MQINLVGADPCHEAGDDDILEQLDEGTFITVLGMNGSMVERHRIGSRGPWREEGGELRCALDMAGSPPVRLYLIRRGLEPLRLVDAEGNPFPPPPNTFQIDAYSTEQPVRSPDEMRRVLERVERYQRPMTVHDQHGHTLGTVLYDPLTRDIREVRTEPYENPDQKAEHPDELVYCVDEHGVISEDRLTRAQAREQGKRYLVVTSLLFHGDNLLLQQRSPAKDIDPEKLSSSAHGVAKQLFTAEGELIKDMRFATLTNAALEVNEELRHGEHTEPFTLKVWPGNERELLEYLHEEKVNSPNTIFFASPTVFVDHGYPLGQWRNRRTRFVTMGHISSTQPPPTTVDPAEVTQVQWCPLNQFLSTGNMTDDVRACLAQTFEQFLRLKTSWGFRHSEKWVRRQMKRLFGTYADGED